MITTHIAMLLILASAELATTTPSAASVELRCGGASTEPAQVIDCLSRAYQRTLGEIDTAQARLEDHLRRIPSRYPNLGELDVQSLHQAWQASQDAWRQFVEGQCGYLEQLHSAIWEGEMEKASCHLRAGIERLEEVSANERFWREKFPLDAP